MNIEEFKSLRSNLSKRSGADELKEIVDDLLSFYEGDQENVTNINADGGTLEIVVDYTSGISIVTGYLTYDLNNVHDWFTEDESQNLEKFLRKCENVDINHVWIKYLISIDMKVNLYDLDMDTPSDEFVDSVEDHINNLKQLYLRCKSENIDVLLGGDDLIDYTEMVLEQIDFIRGDHISAHDDHTDSPFFGFESFNLEFSKEIDPKSIILNEDPSKLVPKNIITDFNQFLSKFNFSNRDKSNLINIIKRGNWTESLNENLSSPIKIRKANIDDYKEIKRISNQHREYLPFVMRVSIEESIKNNGVFVACLEESVVGFIHFHKRKDGITTLHEIGVERGFENKGIGKKLVSIINGPIRLKVTQDNPANEFYRKLGFKFIETISGKKRDLNVYIKEKED